MRSVQWLIFDHAIRANMDLTGRALTLRSAMLEGVRRRCDDGLVKATKLNQGIPHPSHRHPKLSHLAGQIGTSLACPG
jgi:hypothetical protein